RLGLGRDRAVLEGLVEGAFSTASQHQADLTGRGRFAAGGWRSGHGAERARRDADLGTAGLHLQAARLDAVAGPGDQRRQAGRAAVEAYGDRGAAGVRRTGLWCRQLDAFGQLHRGPGRGVVTATALEVERDLGTRLDHTVELPVVVRHAGRLVALELHVLAAARRRDR